MPNLIYTLFRRLRYPLILLILVYAVAILGFVIIPGVDDQGKPWQMSFFHAFYFVSFMGTTIGFGEIPYAFTDAQRFWTLITMYASVISWLYGIGVLLSVFQDRAFRQQMKTNSFSRRIKNIREPFYIICGYGDTGAQLAASLSQENILSVIIDPDESRINEVEAEDFKTHPISLCADASQSEILEMAGIKHPWCQGIVTIADNDTVNLTVAIVAQLLSPDLRLIARAETPEAEANILSFGANEVINPFETFASRLALSLQSPSLYCLYDWMTGAAGQRMKDPPLPTPGMWIICSFGRFGRELYEHLDREGVSIRIIESDRTLRDLPSGSVYGRPTEAETLKKAGIEEAAGIVAGTDNDANNLSILMTAQEINPEIFRVARQNQDKNSHLFQAAELDMLMQRGNVISNTIFALIRTPMLGDFLRIVSRFKNDRANELVSRIIGVVQDDIPELWQLRVIPEESPALCKILETRQVLVEDILRGEVWKEKNDEFEHLKKHIAALPLFLRRGEGNVLLPENNRIVRNGDCFLMCGTYEAHQHMLRINKNINFLESVLCGKEVPSGWLWRKFSKKRTCIEYTQDNVHKHSEKCEENVDKVKTDNEEVSIKQEIKNQATAQKKPEKKEDGSGTESE